MTQATAPHQASEAGKNDAPEAASISLYGPAAVAVGTVASAAGAMFGAVLAFAARAEGDSVMGGVVAAMLLAGSWVLAWGGAAMTGPYRPAVAGMAWLALSTARLLVLIVAGIALALAAPTMGLGLWLALLVGGLTAVGVDCAMALRSFRQHLPVSPGSNDADPESCNSGGSR
ncbi:MAG: hypothetical protein RIE77_09295 [Phycisphaerales bacterium]|jgi:hypothetical protein